MHLKTPRCRGLFAMKKRARDDENAGEGSLVERGAEGLNREESGEKKRLVELLVAHHYLTMHS